MHLKTLTLFFAILVAAHVTSAQSGWALHWYGGKGDFFTEKPDCGPLQFFEKGPIRFDYDHDLGGNTETKDAVKSERIGELSGFEVDQVVHTLSDSDSAMKMIVVRRSSHEFCLIFEEEYSPLIVIARPAYFINVGSERLLATNDVVTGTGSFRIEEYWAFDKKGPLRIDMSPYRRAVQQLLPDGYSIVKGGGPNLLTLSYDSAVWKDGDPNCCPSGGEVHITFAFKHHKLIVLSKEFDMAP
jgi:hypothetical protein